MKFFFTLFGLIIGAGVGSFWAAMVFGASGWALAHWLDKMQSEGKGLPEPESSPLRPDLARSIVQPTSVEDQLRALQARVEVLEERLGVRAPAPQVVPEAEPVVEPVHEPAPTPEPIVAAAPVVEPEPVMATEPIPEPQPIVEPEPVPATEPEPIPQPYREPVPAGPSLLSRLISGNIVAKVGVVVLFLGVGFLLKFAYDHSMLPPQLRLLGVAALAAVLFFFGWRLRERRHLYAMILQGAASGLAYLDVFFALKTYGFIGPALGFGLFALLGVATTLAAVRQDAVVLAVLGLLGAFSAPILASTGSGSHVLLFSYYTLLNVFILAVSWFKAWRSLNLTGWFFTFAVGLFWGANNYRPELFGSVEPFVLLFFALYLVIPILFATRQPPELKGVVDATLVFGTPAAVAVMQAGLVRDLPYGLAWSAAVGSALYGLLTAIVWRHENMRLLRETYLALAIGLATLAIFFAFDAYPTFALWTLEGTAILWIGLRQRHALAWRFAGLVQLAGAALFVMEYAQLERAHAIFNDGVYGCLWVAAAGLTSATLLRRYADRLSGWERPGPTLALLWGALWWAGGGLDALDRALPGELLPAGATLFLAASFLAAEWTGARAGWTQLRALAAAQAPAIALAALAQFADGGHALGNLGYLAWPAAFGVAFWSLVRQERDQAALAALPRYVILWATLALLATWEEFWLMREREYAYGMLLAAAGHVAAWLRYRLRERDREGAAVASAWVLCWGIAFWFMHAALWAERQLDNADLAAAALSFTAATAVLYEWVGRRLGWSGLRHAAMLLWPLLPVAALAQWGLGLRPWEHTGWAAWPVAAGAAFWILRRQVRDGMARLVELRQILLWSTLALLATLEEGWMLQEKQHAYGMLLAAGGFAIAYLRFHRAEREGAGALPVSPALLVWSLTFWFLQAGVWAHERLENAAFLSAMLALAAASAFAYEYAGKRLAWPALRRCALVLWPAMAGVAILQLDRSLAPSAALGWLAWPGALLVEYWCLRRQEADGSAALAPARHALGLWMATFVVGREATGRLAGWEFGTAWIASAWGASFASAIAIATYCGNRERWPVRGRDELYRVAVLGPIALLAAIWVAYSNLGAPGGMAPLPYLPLVNPLDLANAAALGAIVLWSQGFKGEAADTGGFARRIAYVLAFLWVNAIALRSIHFWSGVPYRLDQLLASVLVQATLSLLWTAAALALMFTARRQSARPMWLLGAALLAVVVGKLLLVDLAGSGTVERIVSFIGVGALLLVIGYVAPVPPGEAAEQERS